MKLDGTQILVVEDEWVTARDIQQTLEGLGYQVPQIVASGEEALREAERVRPSLVLMDIRLQGRMDGIEAAARLRERYRTPVIYLSAHTDEVTLERAKRTEPYGYLVKPFTEEELRSTIRTALFKAESERRLRESEQRYRALFEQNPFPMWIFDRDLRIVDVNDTALRHYGYTREEFLALTLLDLRPPEDLPVFFERLWDVMAGRLPLDRRVFRHRRKDGSIISVEVTGVEIAVDGRPLYMVTINDVTDRLAAEAARRESEERFRQLAENIGEVFWMFTPDYSRTLYVSPSYQRVWGEPPENLLRNPRYCVERAFPEDRPVLLEMLSTLPDGEKRAQFRIRRPDGSVRWLEARGFPIRDETGAVVRVAGLTEDITDRKQAEEAVRQSEERFRLMVESVRDYAIILLDPQGRVVHWNTGAERVKGYRAAEILGRSFSVFYPPEEVEHGRAQRALETASQRGDHHDEGWRVRKDGTRFWASATMTALRDRDAQLLGFVKITRDLTERHRTEEAILRKAEMVSLLQATSAAANEAASAEEVFRSVLEEICDYTGWTMGQVFAPDESGSRLVPTGIFHVTSAELLSFVPALQGSDGFAPGVGLPGRVLRSCEPEWIADVEHDPRFRRAAAAHAAGLRAAVAFPVMVGHEPAAVVEFFSDSVAEPDPLLLATVGNIGTQLGRVVERERAERRVLQAKDEAERASRAKSDFLSRMSHELRTPLNVILGFAQLLEVEASETSDRESVEQILRAGRHLLSLIDEVLDLATIEAGRMALSLEPVEVGTVVEESVQMVRALAQGHGVSLEAEFAPGIFARADLQRLRQVLLNLLSNAIKYNRAGGSVRVSCPEPARGRVSIEVQDTGLGMTSEQLARLFVPFERLHEEYHQVQGTGLGLALSRGLVEAMGGTITVRSTPGEGTTFRVELPIAELPEAAVAAPPPAPESPAAASTRRYRVLYIEDNVANLRLIERVLGRRPDIEISAAMQGRLGVELAQQIRPDLILLDVHLPDITGAEVMRRLRDDPALHETPVVVISADATQRQKERLHDAGALAYLTKPIDVRQLLETLRDLLPIGEPGD